MLGTNPKGNWKKCEIRKRPGTSTWGKPEGEKLWTKSKPKRFASHEDGVHVNELGLAQCERKGERWSSMITDLQRRVGVKKKILKMNERSRGNPSGTWEIGGRGCKFQKAARYQAISLAPKKNALCRERGRKGKKSAGEISR